LLRGLNGYERDYDFTSRAIVLSADFADDADSHQENLRSSVKNADSNRKSFSST
jgi:hypothetical protein